MGDLDRGAIRRERIGRADVLGKDEPDGVDHRNCHQQ